MSILFGMRGFETREALTCALRRLATRTAPYAPDGTEILISGPVAMGLQLYHTHRRSRLGKQLTSDTRGNLVSLDGRLDNARELAGLLGLDSDITSDAEIILTAFGVLGEKCFARFVGDWAIVLWSEREQSIYLARDHAGSRALYYELSERQLQWGTYLETFFAEGQKRNLNLEYVGAFLVSQITHLISPYEGISVVPPAHYVVIDQRGFVRTEAHWSWTVRDSLHYETDQEYEEHFRALFRQAVARRTEVDDTPILAELSGGMDSGSIVCVSDVIRRERGASSDELLDTVSYYDALDPNWDELPFIRFVEEARHKRSIHLPSPMFNTDLRPIELPMMYPGQNRTSMENAKRFEAECGGLGYRVILSGLGGDELLGGVPTGLPELSDLLIRSKPHAFLSRAFAWSLPDRVPLIFTIRDSIQFLIEQYSRSTTDKKNIPPGATGLLRRTVRSAEEHSRLVYPRHFAAPSRIANGRAWWRVLETLPHQRPKPFARREYRYPYLDRDLVEFLFRIPRDRLLRPRRRRSMMRAAMKGIVPEEIIERKRKAFRSKSMLPFVSSAHEDLSALCGTGYCVRLGLIHPDALRDTLRSLQRMETMWAAPMVRVLLFELWARECNGSMPLSRAA